MSAAVTQPDPPLSPARQGLLLGVAGTGLWVLLAYPAFALAGIDGVIGLSVSAILCLLPGLVVLLVLGQFAATQPMAPFAGSAVRLFCVGVGCLVVRVVRPDWGFQGFFLWVSLYYFVLLILETFLLVRHLPRSSTTSEQASLDDELDSA